MGGGVDLFHVEIGAELFEETPAFMRKIAVGEFLDGADMVRSFLRVDVENEVDAARLEQIEGAVKSNFPVAHGAESESANDHVDGAELRLPVQDIGGNSVGVVAEKKTLDVVAAGEAATSTAKHAGGKIEPDDFPMQANLVSKERKILAGAAGEIECSRAWFFGKMPKRVRAKRTIKRPKKQIVVGSNQIVKHHTQ